MEEPTRTRQQLMDEINRLNRRIAELEAGAARTEEEVEAKASELKSQFLAHISHEIRTPLNGIIGMANLLLDCRLTDEQREFADIIHRSADALLSILNDILDLSKVEAGQLDLEILDFDLRVMLEGLAGPLKQRARSKGLTFSLTIHPEVPSLVCGDPGRLKQVLVHLMTNAVKFTEQGAVTVRVLLESEADDHSMVRFEIKDTGIGISPEQKDQVFRSFAPLDAAMNRKGQGTGLGLALAKQLAELLGGGIGVESEPGRGSTFWFTARLGKQMSCLPEGVRPAVDLAGKRILVVDDNEINRRVLKEYLQLWGCVFDEAANQSAAIRKMLRAAEAGEAFQAVLVDQGITLPEVAALCRKVHADPRLRRTALVVTSSVGKRGDAARMKSLGFWAYLASPLTSAVLRDCLVSLFEILADPAGEPPQQIMTRHSLAESRKQKIRILVADDNPVNQKLALRVLEKLGYQADAVNSGRTAVEALGRFPYSLVLMDVRMPEMDGYEATRIIRDPASAVLSHQVPIVALTAHDTKDDRQACMKAGMDAYLAKPLNPERLAETIENLLASL